jgi:hypothetical protein
VCGQKGDPLLERLLQIARRYDAHAETYDLLRHQQLWLRQIAAILDPATHLPPMAEDTERASEVAWELEGFLADLARQAERDPRHHPFVDEVRKWARNWGAGLFACFLEPALPRTNNDLERFLRQVKGQHRRITGRRSWQDYVLRYGPHLAFHEPSETPATVLGRLRRVPAATFSRARAHWRHSQARILQSRRYRRDPARYLRQLEAAWSP